VSNIGFCYRMQQPRRPPRGRQMRGGAVSVSAAAMPSVAEQRSSEASDDLIEGSPTNTVQRGADKFLRLGDLDAATCKKMRHTTSNDDNFSAVHEQHMAMRSRIPGDEMPVNLLRANVGTRQTKAKADPGAKGRAKATPATPDDDACSAVTFSFDFGGARASAPPPPMPDDDNSDVGSAVTFNFSLEQPRSQPKVGKRAPGRLVPPSAPADDGVGDEQQPTRSHKKNDVGPTCRGQGDGKASTSRQGGRPRQAAPPPMRTSRGRAPPARVPVPIPEPAALEESDDDEEGGEESQVDDDTFTSVALSTRPRDPYLGLRDGRLMGGGIVTGVDGKWRAPGGKIAHATGLRFGDGI